MDKRELPPAIRAIVDRARLELKVDLEEFDAEFFERFADAQWPASRTLLEEYCVNRFNRGAKDMLVFSQSPDPTAINPLYEQHLDHIIKDTKAFLNRVLVHVSSALRNDVITKVMLKLGGRKLSWLARAKRDHLQRTDSGAADIARRARQELETFPKPAPTSDSAATTSASSRTSRAASQTAEDNSTQTLDEVKPGPPASRTAANAAAAIDPNNEEPSAAEGTASQADDGASTADRDEVASPSGPPAVPTTSNRAAVDAYIEEVLAATGQRINRRMFWKAAGYKHPTDFERWQRGDKRTTKTARVNFERVLRTKPHLKRSR